MANRIVYIVGFNMPGYMSENDPHVFFSFDQAKRALIEDLKNGGESRQSEESAEVFCSMVEDVNLWSGEGNTRTMPDGYVYWINTDWIDEKHEALCEYLDCQPSEIEESKWDTWEYGNQEYRVLTDSEANEACAEYIEDSLWAFNPDFLARHMGLPNEAREMIKSFCRDKCESANDTIRAMLGDKLESLISDAIACDGRGHFIASYDGEEDDSPCGKFYIYRVN